MNEPDGSFAAEFEEPDVPEWLRSGLEEHYRELIRFAGSRAGDETDPHDLVHEAVRIALQKYDQLDDRSKLKNWMCSIIVNLNRDLHRKRKPDVSTEDLHFLQGETESPEEADSDMFRLLAGLPTVQREAFLLKEYAGMSVSELATVQGTNENTVKSRLYQAREKLKDKLR